MKTVSNGRIIVDLNSEWKFFDSDVGLKKAISSRVKSGRVVSLPHSNKIFPYHNFDEKEYQFISWYVNRFRLPSIAKGKRVFVEFDGVMIAAKVYFNGQFIGEHKGGFTNFRFELTKYIKHKADNVLAVQVDSRERKDIPPFGNVVDYLTFGGMYREARLIITDKLYLEDFWVCGFNVLKEEKTLLVQYDISNGGAKCKADLIFQLLDSNDKVVAETSKQLNIKANGKVSENLAVQGIREVKLWDIEEPNLYRTRLILKEGEKISDIVEKSFGFREAHFAKDGKFYLNGKHVKLIGLDRHQNYPYIGAAAGWRLQYNDADILKNELGLNIVRTSHYPQSPHFLDRCDQIGLLVFEEIPGWQYIGNKKWQAVSLNELKEMIIRDRHHPSIVLWGVRINESKDNREFYTKTNALAHKLDPTRQTGGVRYIRESEFLEDVFTYNDFSGTVQQPNHIPYLITEFAGHTYPTKTIDSIEKQYKHTLLHAKIMNLQLGNSKIAGAIGWCAFDYNTHIEFGSGDRICYHGVYDIFRLPKFAGLFYKSQMPAEKGVVLEALDYWARGDWDVGPRSLTILSNCEEVEVRIGSRKLGIFKPRYDKFPNLKHPPIVVDNIRDQWGYKWEDLTLIGKIKGKRVAIRKYPADKLPAKLKGWVEHTEIFADGRDMTRLAFVMTDKYGNICPYATDIVTIESTKNVEIIGENPFALFGGRGAVYLKAGKRKGIAKFHLHSSYGYDCDVTLKLV